MTKLAIIPGRAGIVADDFTQDWYPEAQAELQYWLDSGEDFETDPLESWTADDYVALCKRHGTFHIMAVSYAAETRDDAVLEAIYELQLSNELSDDDRRILDLAATLPIEDLAPADIDVPVDECRVVAFPADEATLERVMELVKAEYAEAHEQICEEFDDFKNRLLDGLRERFADEEFNS